MPSPAPSSSTRYDQIILRAAGLFAESGFAGSSMQDLANAVGITKASLYHFFHDKEQIHSEVVNRSLEMLNNFVDEEVASQDRAYDKVLGYCRAHGRHLSQNRDLYISALAAHGYHTLASAKMKKQARGLTDAYERRLRDIIDLGIKNGEFRDIDVPLAARAIISCLNWMPRWWNPRGEKSAATIACEFGELIMNSFLAPRCSNAAPEALSSEMPVRVKKTRQSKR